MSLRFLPWFLAAFVGFTLGYAVHGTARKPLPPVAPDTVIVHQTDTVRVVVVHGEVCQWTPFETKCPKHSPRKP